MISKYIWIYKKADASDIDLIFKEAEMLKSLNHKNIVKIINCYAFKNLECVFIMEYL